MSVFSSIGSGIEKAISFVVTVFSKTKQVEDMFVALAPATKAAILATFYDVTKTIAAGTAAAAAASAGNIPVAITLSEATLALIKNVITDAKTDTSVIAADLKALGVII